jgi:hypothetical protein
MLITFLEDFERTSWDEMMEMKKILSLTMILLFIGVAIAPSINYTVVKASDDNDLIEVTTQACGIKGYGNTTVKLTKQQYQNLEQYLVNFRARLNQTTTRDEAVPLFKEAVVELDKYGLLPKGMSIETAKRLVHHINEIPIVTNLLERTAQTHPGLVNGSENHLCLIAGKTTETWFEGPVAILSYKLLLLSALFFGGPISSIFLMLSLGGFLLLNVFSARNPFAVLYRVGFGGLYSEHDYIPWEFYASGWVSTVGLNGRKTWQGNMQGTLPIEGTRIPGGASYTEYYTGAVGFTGIKTSSLGGSTFYLGSALWVKIDG